MRVNPLLYKICDNSINFAIGIATSTKSAFQRPSDWFLMYCGYRYLRDTFRTTALSLSNEAVVNSGVNKLVRADSQLFVPPRMAPDKTI